MVLLKILLIHGPNLNMLGIREKNIYGAMDLESVNQSIMESARQKNIDIEIFQSNHEGEIIDCIHAHYEQVDCIIINPAALSHYSIALYDALKAVNIPIIEVHISNIHARESFRNHSYISPIAMGGIFGLGIRGYFYALDAACDLIRKQN